jgi:hypothetical protein
MSIPFIINIITYNLPFILSQVLVFIILVLYAEGVTREIAVSTLYGFACSLMAILLTYYAIKDTLNDEGPVVHQLDDDLINDSV